MGMGAMIRDFKGDVMACLCSTHKFISSPIVAAYRALRKTMQFCVELGFKLAIFEGDSQLLVEAINREEDSETWYGHLVAEVKTWFKNRQQWTISFIHREGNQAAHKSAKCLNLLEEKVWIEVSPNVILNVVIDEQSKL